MMGDETNEGLIQFICNEILKRADKEVNKENCCSKYELTVSMFELYNEKIQDLFLDPNNRVKSGLKVHQNPILGVFVGNLSKVSITSIKTLQLQLDIGNTNKALGVMRMNSKTSDGYTICELIFKQYYLVLYIRT